MAERTPLKSISVTSEAETAALAQKLAPFLRVQDILTLNGTLGAGKTAFARALIRALCGADIEVPSPTFNLLLTYERAAAPVFHYDLYRLEDPEEVWELDIEEAFSSGITLIEWAENLQDLAPQNVLEITMQIPNAAPEGMRLITFSGDKHWQQRLQTLEG